MYPLYMRYVLIASRTRFCLGVMCWSIGVDPSYRSFPGRSSGVIHRALYSAPSFSILRNLKLLRYCAIMPLTQKNVDELKKIYKETVGEELTDKGAWEMAIRLLNIFRILQDAPPSASAVCREGD